MDWMGSLLNHRAKFEKKVLENWNQAQELVEDKLWQNLKVFFEVKGIRPSMVDFMSYVEKWSPQTSREAMSYFLDFFRSSTLGMGLRVAKLSDVHIEVVLPNRLRNLDEDGHFLDSSIITAGIEALKILWLRHAPVGEFHFEISKINFEKVKSLRGYSQSSLRIKYELPIEFREHALTVLREQNQFSSDFDLSVYDENDSLVSSIKVTVRLTNTLQIGEKASETTGRS